MTSSATIETSEQREKEALGAEPRNNLDQLVGAFLQHLMRLQNEQPDTFNAIEKEATKLLQREFVTTAINQLFERIAARFDTGLAAWVEKPHQEKREVFNKFIRFMLCSLPQFAQKNFDLACDRLFLTPVQKEILHDSTQLLADLIKSKVFRFLYPTALAVNLPTVVDDTHMFSPDWKSIDKVQIDGFNLAEYNESFDVINGRPLAVLVMRFVKYSEGHSGQEYRDIQPIKRNSLINESRQVKAFFDMDGNPVMMYVSGFTTTTRRKAGYTYPVDATMSEHEFMETQTPVGSIPLFFVFLQNDTEATDEEFENEMRAKLLQARIITEDTQVIYSQENPPDSIQIRTFGEFIGLRASLDTVLAKLGTLKTKEGKQHSVLGRSMPRGQQYDLQLLGRLPTVDVAQLLSEQSQNPTHLRYLTEAINNVLVTNV